MRTRARLSREHRFKPCAGANSKKGPRAQPPDLVDVLLHETAVSWLRRQEEQAWPARPWQESPRELEERLQQSADWINKVFDAHGLCMGLPDRLHALVSEAKWDRLPT